MVTRLERCKQANRTISEQFRQKWFKWIVKHQNRVNWAQISYHPYVTLELIHANPTYPWVWYYISLNPNVPIEYIKANTDKPWIWNYISTRIDLESIRSNPDLPWTWDGMHANKHMTIEFVKEYKDKPWNWHRLSMCEYVTMDDITANPDLPWSEEGICNNTNLTMEFIKANPDKPWNWQVISQSRKITIHDILANLDKPWDWFQISYNRTITMQDIESNPTLPWNWNGISYKTNITINFMKDNWNKLSRISLMYNTLINTDTVQFLMEKGLYTNPNVVGYNILNYNPNITLKFIKANQNYQWYWSGLSQNPHLTMAFVDEYFDLENTNWYYISHHEFTVDKQDYRLAKYREYLAAYRIQQWWHKLRLDPRHPVGIRRLEREYDSLFAIHN